MSYTIQPTQHTQEPVPCSNLVYQIRVCIWTYLEEFQFPLPCPFSTWRLIALVSEEVFGRMVAGRWQAESGCYAEKDDHHRRSKASRKIQGRADVMVVCAQQDRCYVELELILACDHGWTRCFIGILPRRCLLPLRTLRAESL